MPCGHCASLCWLCSSGLPSILHVSQLTVELGSMPHPIVIAQLVMEFVSIDIPSQGKPNRYVCAAGNRHGVSLWCANGYTCSVVQDANAEMRLVI